MIVRKGQRLGSLLHETEDEPGPEPSPEDQAPEAPPADEPKRPAPADRKEAWVDYAVTKGFDRGEAEVMTKAELVELLREDADNGDDDTP